ncbi:MAG TPA: oligosaccharide flippase family protein [Pyrinomonadaceae bacterium]|nr:oligosaccharide flippase family protein [Pyrinomonadaceae bacterium]
MLEQPIEEATATAAVAAGSSRRGFSAHVAWTFGARILMTVNSVAAGVIVARWLGAEGLGQLAVINVAVATVVQLGSAGLPSANTYFIARDKKDFVPAAINSLLFAVVVGGLLALGLTWLAALRPGWFGFIPPRLVAIAALSIPFQLVTLIGLNIFLAVGRVERFNLLDLLGQSFVLVNAVLALIILGAGLWMLVILNTGASAFVAIIIAALVWVYGARMEGGARWRPSLRLFGRMMRYGVKFHVSVLAGLLIFRADLLVVNYFRGEAEAGVYSVASQVAMMLMLLPGVIATLLFPRVAAQRDETGELTCVVTRHTAFVMLFVCLAAVPLSFVLPLLYGAKFADVSVQLLILLPGVYLIGLESVLVQHFNATGLPVAIPLFWVATLLLNLALTFALVPPLGARGAALASAASYALIFALIALYFRARTGRRLSEALIVRGDELRKLLALVKTRGHRPGL